MLKGLTFTAERTPSKEPIVIVSARYDEVDYKTEIDDFAKCQHPRVLLTTEACIDFICDNIQHANYKFNETRSKISLSLRVFQNVTIQMQLDCPEIETDNIELKIVRLEKRLAALEHYELVTSHKYPKWDTLEEFKNLPDFKYFKVAENYQTLVKRQDSHDGFNGFILGEAFGREYGIRLPDKTKFGTPEFFKTFTWCMAPYIAGDSRIPHTKPTYPHGSILDRALIETTAETVAFDPYAHFPRSVQILVLEKYISISHWLMLYIGPYIRGYILVNHETFALREVKIVVYISSEYNTCHIDIYRAKVPNIHEGLFGGLYTFDDEKKHINNCDMPKYLYNSTHTYIDGVNLTESIDKRIGRLEGKLDRLIYVMDDKIDKLIGKHVEELMDRGIDKINKCMDNKINECVDGKINRLDERIAELDDRIDELEI